MRGALICVLLLAVPATAETIVLKNGRKIFADTVRENGLKVEYTVGEDTYAISKSSVQRIDTGGTPIVTRSEPAPEVKVGLGTLTLDADLMSRLVKDGKLDTELLAAVIREGPPERAAGANVFVALHLRSAGKLDEALRYMMQARSILPQNGIVAVNYAAVLTELHRYNEATSAAEEAVRVAPQLGASHAILGYCDYQLGRLAEAVRELKKSLEIERDAQVEELLAKVERELAAESKFSEESSSHFALKYEGGQAPAPFRRQMLEVLERHYNDLEHDLDYSPRSPIQVVLYTQQQFFDLTKAPQWTGALNDGKLRIPINGLQQVDSNLSRVLKHELAHSFINLASNGRAPTWLNEGIAQLEEPQSIARDGKRLASLYSSGHNIPLNQLETSFTRFSEAEAAVAYAQSLASAEYIREVYGISSLSLMLKRLAEGQSNETALRSAVHSGYAEFDRELSLWLTKNY
jgi:tetratricopeptide (TPR) repeat protein